jgi:hypothetical protein
VKPAAFHDLAASAFPLTLRAYRVDTDELVWEVRIDGPAAVEVPPLKRQLGVAVRMEIETADD